MWIMFLVIMSKPTSSFNDSTIAVTQSEFLTKESCIAAVNFSKTRQRVTDAWCVKK